jgi:GNAT superfamily N-acetyltransferase
VTDAHRFAGRDASGLLITTETGMSVQDILIRSATQADIPQILSFIRALADYENLSKACVATEALLHENLFGLAKAAEVLIAEIDSRPVGFALFFGSFSTFLARPGIYLEDLFVLPEARGHGVGKALLKAVARIAVQRDCGRLEWAVLDWNEPAIGFYKSVGAVPMEEWTTYRMTCDNLKRLAE